jgi:hypothetical protein
VVGKLPQVPAVAVSQLFKVYMEKYDYREGAVNQPAARGNERADYREGAVNQPAGKGDGEFSFSMEFKEVAASSLEEFARKVHELPTVSVIVGVVITSKDFCYKRGTVQASSLLEFAGKVQELAKDGKRVCTIIAIVLIRKELP